MNNTQNNYNDIKCLFKTTLNPHLNLVNYNLVLKKIINLLTINYTKKIKILDIGGGRGFGNIFINNHIDYNVLDLNIQKSSNEKINYIQGDITSKNLDLGHKFDLIFTKDTYEHILNPWDSTDNIINHLLEDGIFFFIAPFSWRYHASPYDAFRYSHTGVQYLFERNNKLKKIASGYSSKIKTNGFWKNKKDFTLDNKPFTECIETVYLGQKDSSYVFNKDVLDVDLSPKHDY